MQLACLSYLCICARNGPCLPRYILPVLSLIPRAILATWPVSRSSIGTKRKDPQHVMEVPQALGFRKPRSARWANLRTCTRLALRRPSGPPKNLLAKCTAHTTLERASNGKRCLSLMHQKYGGYLGASPDTRFLRSPAPTILKMLLGHSALLSDDTNMSVSSW